ncbi:GMC family oxidoreductase [Sorangium sp. So ce726]|uniref:GMC family oxidoreductase n=1 Tax=Sorangium sp. So ce726 TaxID=3133319 RepID=UPI003F63D500
MSDNEHYDVVIVGAGVAGALMAKHLTHAGLRVLLLEAGPATAWAYDGYVRHLEHFYTASAKGAESAWPPAANAPQPDTGDLRRKDGYFVQEGPHLYGSSYSRLQGGSTLHWLGVSLRMLPEDFRLRSLRGVGRDWPLGYDEIEPYYRRAEREIGVAADVAEQRHHGLTFAEGYDYPMQRVPPSYSDQVLARAVDGMEVTFGEERFTLKVRSYPAARNSIPRGDYRPVGAVDERDGAAIATDLGERCSGNTSCTPICPIQAKYNAQKTLAQARRTGRLEIRAQAVASRIHVDPVSGAVQSIECQRYDDPSSPRHLVERVTGRAYVLAAHAVENAKLMLVSGLGGKSGLLGRNLMDHPTLYAWGLSPVPIGAFRGPLSTSGIEDLRGGAFRAKHAAFRFDIGNDGWKASTGAPETTVAAAVQRDRLFGRRLREHLASTLSRQIRFSLAVEQLPDADNGVSIDPRYLDPLGNPRPVIRYRIGDYTLAGMAAATTVYRDVFRRAGVTDCTDPEQGSWFPSVSWQGQVFHYHGMGHFAGTHVMGDDAGQSVIDRDQRSWEHRNLYLIGSGSFPTMGTSNPTLTLAALAIRSADRLIAQLGST